MKKSKREPASFRDPSGFVFWKEGKAYRQINETYRANYDLMMQSGLYQKLVNEKLLIPHQEVDETPHSPNRAYRVIQPEQIPFISYPYEWSFSQLQDAALTTLEIQTIALDFGMKLKDSSAYNIQFRDGKPVLIDTLSFEKYEEGQPWVGYRQFCQHFLAPLSLMSYQDIRLHKLMRVYIDGIPLDLASSLLPFQTYLKFPLLTHLHLHAVAQKRFAGQRVDTSSKDKVGRRGMEGIISSLKGIIRSLSWDPSGTKWFDYTTSHNYSKPAINHKKKKIEQYLEIVQPESVWDLGANTGTFSRLASQQNISTIAFDFDPGVVELNYQQCVVDEDKHLLPLVLDLTNPSPNIGWHNAERRALNERPNPDMIFALALVHHLAIANNIPLKRIVQFLSDLGKWLVIEFIPKDDHQTQKLLANREDIFPRYSRTTFEKAFSLLYQIEDSQAIKDSKRAIYLMKRIN